jgi:hypothetical protein
MFIRPDGSVGGGMPIQKFTIYQLIEPYTKDVCVQVNAQGCMKYNKVTYNKGEFIQSNSDNQVTIDDTKTLYFRGYITPNGQQTEIPLSVLKKLGTNLTIEESIKLQKNATPNVTTTTNEITNVTISNNSKKTITILLVVLATLGLLKWKKII